MRPSAIVVCPVLPHPPVSGGRKRTLRMLEALERAGGHPHLLTDDASDAAGAEQLRDRGWTVEVIPEPPPSIPARVAQHAARRPSPLLHGVTARLDALVAGGAAMVQLEHTQSAYHLPQGLPVVLSLHNLDSSRLLTEARGRRPGTWDWARMHNMARATRAVERRAFPRVTCAVCVSAADAAAAAAAGAHTLVARNGVDDDLFDVAPPPEAPRAAFMGDFGYAPNRRGLSRFLAEGWPACRRALPDATLAIAGPGLTPRTAAGLAVPGVELHGLVPDVAAFLGAARAVVVPIWEGGGVRLKVLEALAAGRPVVSTALGVDGIGVRDGREGLLSEHPATLGALLAGVLAPGDGAAAMGGRGRALAEPLRWRLALAPLEDAYRGWLAARNSAS